MKQRVLFIISILILLFFVFFLIHTEFLQRENDYVSNNLAVFDTRIDATSKTLSDFSRYVFEQSINKKEILNLMTAAVNANAEEQTVIRAALHGLISDNYELLLRYNFRQLHFQLPNNTSFLRMHSVDSFGDDLTTVRETIRRVNETLLPVIAYEEGRIYNGYRFVYPLINNGFHCGSVEISFSMNSFITILSQLETADYYFGIKRAAVDGIIFETDRYRYIDSCFSPEFLFDREVLPINTNDDFFAKNSKQLTTILNSNISGGFVARYAGKYKLVLVNFIHNLSNDSVACFISVSDETEYSNIKKDYWWVYAITLVIFSLLIIIAFLLINDREKLKHLSLTDMLTGLKNRNAIVEIMDHELDRAKRYQKQLSIMMVDIDNFKQVNDRYGHAEGDEVLRNLSQLLCSALRSSDYASRWGGEEFLILLTDTHFESAIIACEKFCNEVSSSYLSTYTPVTVSIGVTTYVSGDTIDSLVARADKALYDAKNQGKNRVVGIKKD